MNIHPTFTNIRSVTLYQFSALRMRALRDSFWAKLTARNSKLATFPGQSQRDNPNRKLIGVIDIPVDQIIGTLNRDCDFDHKFRPLGKHLLNRWVNTFISLDHGGWSPILVHKIGEQYYVEDGHHRVSVARSIGMVSIEAKVWQYPAHQKRAANCEPIRCTQRSPAKAAQRVAG